MITEIEELDVLHPDVQQMIGYKASRIFNIPMEQDDLIQELRLAVIEYCADKSPEQRSLGAIYRTLNQRVYSLVKRYVTFDGCSLETAQMKRNIARPLSLNAAIDATQSNFAHSPEFENESLLPFIALLRDATDHQGDQMALLDFVAFFADTLSTRDRDIFMLLIEGINKPRYICEEMHGHKNLKECKLISRRVILIKEKFVQLWRQEYGKIVKL